MTVESFEKDWRPQTRMVRGGTRRTGFDETSEAIFMTSGFVYGTAEDAEAAFRNEVDRFIYSRFGNPTLETFQDRMCLIEGAEACRGTASGMAAVFASLACFVKAGQRVVGPRALFGSCRYILSDILPGYGIETGIVDGTDLDQWRDALKKPTAAVFLETPSNPGLEIVDIEAVARLAHDAGALLVVDNVFASPLMQRPMQYGADVVAYSATKHIDGQGRCMGGAILASQDFIDRKLSAFYRHTGPSMSPFNAWVLLKGLETLELRMARHCANAQALAELLESRKEVSRALYPGLASHPQHALAARQMTGYGSVVCLDLGGSKERAFRFLNALRIFDISNNLGDAKSLATHPATTTHQRLAPKERAHLGITDGFVRLSVGLEDVDDLKEDIERALKEAG